MVQLDLPAELEHELSALVPDQSRLVATAHVQVAPLDGSWHVTAGGICHVAETPSVVVQRVLEVCNGLAIEQCRDLAVHAGVVARQGRVLALPAPSGTGKSTLVAALLRQGWDYVSDEALVLDRSGLVRPYPKWLSLHRWTLERLGLRPPDEGASERPALATELGAVVDRRATLRLSDVVLPHRAASTSLSRVHRAQAATSLLTHSFNHYRDPAASLQLAAEVIRPVGCWQLDLADPVRAAELLTAQLG